MAPEPHSNADHVDPTHADPLAAPGADPHAVPHADHGSHDPLDPAHLLGHVQDAEYFEVPKSFGGDGHIYLPQLRSSSEPVFTPHTGVKQIDDILQPMTLRFTKFMALELVAAVLIAAFFVWLGSRVKSGAAPKGKLWNLLEVLLVFIRDQVARPAIGKHDADRFLPFLWTLFFFILMGNLLGMVPWSGSYTGSFAVTGVLALITYAVVLCSGMIKLGPVKYWTSQAPHMDVHWSLGLILKPLIMALEIFGNLIKHLVLAVRLLANIFAGHLVLAVIIAFIGATAGTALYWGVMPASILGAFALSILELFVAFLQAYIFVFLASLFIGTALHPH